ASLLLPTRRRPSDICESVDSTFSGDGERPVALLLQIPPFLDGVELPERNPQEFADVTHDDALNPSIRPGFRHVVPEQVERDDRLDARVAPQALQLPRGVERIRLHDDGSRPEDREERDDEMG